MKIEYTFGLETFEYEVNDSDVVHLLSKSLDQEPEEIELIFDEIVDEYIKLIKDEYHYHAETEYEENKIIEKGGYDELYGVSKND